VETIQTNTVRFISKCISILHTFTIYLIPSAKVVHIYCLSKYIFYNAGPSNDKAELQEHQSSRPPGVLQDFLSVYKNKSAKCCLH